ncbi:MAG TPA: hypothetical protein PK397_10180 [Ignavibacteriaceae bacterium]|nr:hypothetical protein [Ignavibacteriaceae bacterium]
MKILILTQFFPPEIGAPQNRLFDLAKRLNDNSEEIDILTAMPNYPNMCIYDGYKKKLMKVEYIEGLRVFRS